MAKDHKDDDDDDENEDAKAESKNETSQSLIPQRKHSHLLAATAEGNGFLRTVLAAECREPSAHHALGCTTPLYPLLADLPLPVARTDLRIWSTFTEQNRTEFSLGMKQLQLLSSRLE